jgi:hypothetical protein
VPTLESRTSIFYNISSSSARLGEIVVEFNSTFPVPPSRHSLVTWPALPHLKQRPLFVASLASTRFGRLTNFFGVAGLPLDLPSGASFDSHLRFANLDLLPPKDLSKGFFPFGISERPTCRASLSRITTSSNYNIVVGRFSLSHTLRRIDSSRLARNAPIMPSCGFFSQSYC